VTPFNGAALLAMLLAFYPTVSGSELARARRERPEYFAAGVLFGSKGDKLQLPDGRVYDLIANAGGAPGTQRWQVIEPGPGSDEPWPLEPGPLTPIDVAAITPAPSDDSTFETLVSGAIGEIDGSDRTLDQARSTLADGATAGGLGDDGGHELDDVAEATAEIERARSADAIGDILGQSDGMSAAIETTDAAHDDPPPDPQLPPPPDPVPYPPTDNNPPPPDDGGSKPYDY
jgi:hypothetical protein